MYISVPEDFMKKRLSFITAALILFMLGAQVFGSVAADSVDDQNISSVDSGSELSKSESSESISQSEESPLFEEPANKKFTWLYILIAVAAVAIVITVIVYISKKQ